MQLCFVTISLNVAMNWITGFLCQNQRASKLRSYM